MTVPRLALDTNVLLGAFERREPPCRLLIDAGRSGRAILAVSRTLDQELHGSAFPDDELWPYVQSLSRLPRPSARLGRLRLGEAALGYGGLGGSLAHGKGDRSGSHAVRDEEHLEGADVWNADAFVTSESGLLKRGELLGVRIVTPAAALEMLGNAT